MGKRKPKPGHKFSRGHEVSEGFRWDNKLEKAVKETRGKQPGGPTARSLAISFGISQIDEEELRETLAELDRVSRSTLLYQFFQAGMRALKKGKLSAKETLPPARPVVVLLSVNHLDDLELAQQAWKLGAAIITPALNSAQLRFGLPDQLFDQATLSFVRTSDAVLFGRGVGKSDRAPEIKAHAQTHGKPILSTLAQLSRWMSRTKKAA